MIEFKEVTTIYDNDETIEILNGVNLEIKDGEFVSIIGPAGAGKSTMLRLLTREISPHKGEIVLDGVNLAHIPPKAIPLLRRKIGTVYQDFKLLSNKTAFENVAFAMEVCGADRDEIEIDVPKILGIVGLGDKLRIILADEPTGNLDLVNSYDVVKLLMKINELGTTVILATHNREVVNAIGKRVLSIEKGKIVRDQVENGKYVI